LAETEQGDFKNDDGKFRVFVRLMTRSKTANNF
jgi:hypothetical protein